MGRFIVSSVIIAATKQQPGHNDTSHLYISCEIYRYHYYGWVNYHFCRRLLCVLRYGFHFFMDSARFNKFLKSTATVSGPTPPGTGVIYDALTLTESKSTSPTVLPSASETPASITITPS